MILLKFILYGIITISVFIVNYIYNTHFYKKYILHIPDNFEASTQLLTQYSKWDVIGIYICKQPINSFLNKCINFITFDTFSILCKLLNYNNIYHISLIFILKLDTNYKIILVDKQHTILVSDIFTIDNTRMELCSVQLGSHQKKFGEMIYKTYSINKEEYNTYEILTNNCQTFAYNFMIANNLLTDLYKQFILQDLQSVESNIPKFAHKFMNGCVYLYNIIEIKLDYYWNKIFNTSLIEDLMKIDNSYEEDTVQNGKKND